MANEDALYRTWDSDSQRQQAYAQTSDNVEAYDGVQKALAYGRRTSYIDIEPNRSVRTSFLRSDYDNFRPGESVSNRQKRIIKQCMQAYDKVGIIRNVIDLMRDFASQGLVLVHPNKTIEKFYRKWWQEVGGVDRSERFLNYLYRTGNVVVRRRTAKINKQQEKSLRNSLAADMKIEPMKVLKREIPWSYDFLNPLAIDIKNNGSYIVGKPEFLLNISKNSYEQLVKTDNSPNTIFKTLPLDIQ